MLYLNFFGTDVSAARDPLPATLPCIIRYRSFILLNLAFEYEKCTSASKIRKKNSKASKWFKLNFRCISSVLFGFVLRTLNFFEFYTLNLQHYSYLLISWHFIAINHQPVLKFAKQVWKLKISSSFIYRRPNTHPSKFIMNISTTLIGILYTNPSSVI